MMRKLVLKSTTKMSLNDRFTQLRNHHAEFTVHKIRENNALRQQASIKNQRLAQQMERRPAVIAALRLKKKSVRQRLGQPMLQASVKDRLSLGQRLGRGSFRGARASLSWRGRGTTRGTARGTSRGQRGLYRLSRSDSMTSLRSLRRSQSVTSLNRSASMTSLNKFPRGRGTRGTRGSLRRPYRRGFRGVRAGQFSQRGTYGRRTFRGSRYSQQGQRGRGRGTFRYSSGSTRAVHDVLTKQLALTGTIFTYEKPTQVSYLCTYSTTLCNINFFFYSK
ncbi:chromatin target of PRMT1 protein-like [Bacillus rossius redtenbacheri]|uniref:chromatin target of PRMT1 protein-like n=1 Tax=Bacillus rossius redtenbacheri TaxID=93214 RepID=UPI002FDEDDC9